MVVAASAAAASKDIFSYDLDGVDCCCPLFLLLLMFWSSLHVVVGTVVVALNAVVFVVVYLVLHCCCFAVVDGGDAVVLVAAALAAASVVVLHTGMEYYVLHILKMAWQQQAYSCTTCLQSMDRAFVCIAILPVSQLHPSSPLDQRDPRPAKGALAPKASKGPSRGLRHPNQRLCHG